MKMMAILAGAGVLALGLSGCSPKLDQPQLSPEEQVWADYIKQNYSAWQPPVAEPRGVRGTEQPEAPTAAPAAAPAEEAPAAAEAPAQDAGFYGTPETSGNAVATAPAAAKAPAEEAPAAAEAAPEIYTVVKGDTLGGIARKFYGRASAWKQIQDANADLLKGKTVIRPGMKLTIPKP